MTTVADLFNFIGNGMVNLIFGNPLLTAIFVFMFMAIGFWKVGVSKDGVIVVFVPLVVLFGTNSFFPQATVIVTYMIIGIMMFLIFMKILEK